MSSAIPPASHNNYCWAIAAPSGPVSGAVMGVFNVAFVPNRKCWRPGRCNLLRRAVRPYERTLGDPGARIDSVVEPEYTGKFAFETAGGAITRPPTIPGAFAHRDIRYVVQYQSRWRPFASDAVANANTAWTNAAYESVRSWLSGSAYQGYADPGLPDWQRQYYGTSLNRYPQSIPPAPA